MSGSTSSYAAPPPSYHSVDPYAYGTIVPASQYPQRSRPAESATAHNSWSISCPSTPSRKNIPNEPSEASSLCSTSTYRLKRFHKIPLLLWGALVFLTIIVMCQNTGYMPTLIDDIPLSEKAAIRRKWRLEKKLWVLEKTRHQDEVDVWEHERQEWQAEREVYEKEKEEWARRRREEEMHRKEMEWKRKGAHWSEPSGSAQCTAFETRMYTAELLDLPMNVDPIQACSDMPINFHGRILDEPAHCENKGDRTWATWYIDFDEPQCATYWDTLRDKGCSAGERGYRRFTAGLLNLRSGDDYDEMCRTTPANIGGVHFDHPTACERNWFGRTGIWDVPDGRC
ncbi:hypothetical protein BD309DRAFT_953781 [Dichomitus squalens]|uniref:Uncharacterized protein n=1 Tax=Dichomitus squalens TaxID=114155 RepID=A0A4Q9NXN5_9APHY|nr:hypothetical protein BD309DRAFT_953781 [Dichomitus squalens]TBU58423.1 hypothetical protein BD310DRAFT_927277 [Dichomitus squalens]